MAKKQRGGTRPSYPAEFRRRMVELVRLRRENRTLREEKEILRKAAAWFAQETTKSNPTKRSGS